MFYKPEIKTNIVCLYCVKRTFQYAKILAQRRQCIFKCTCVYDQAISM